MQPFISIRRLVFLVFIFFLFFIGLRGQAQAVNKPALDSFAIERWESLVSCSISPHGKYVGYIIDQPMIRNSTFVISDTGGKWSRQYKNVAACYFSSDDKLAVFQ